MVEAVGAMRRPRPLRLVGRCPGAWRRRCGGGRASWGPGRVRRVAAPSFCMEQAAASSAGLSLLRPLPNYLHSLPTKVVSTWRWARRWWPPTCPAPGAVAGLAGVMLVPPCDPTAAAAALDRVVGDGEARRETAARLPRCGAAGLALRRVVALYREAAERGAGS